MKIVLRRFILYRKASSNPTSGQATPIAFAPIEDGDISKSTNRFTSNTVYDDAGNATQDTKYRNQNFWYDANGRMYRTTDVSQPNQSNAVYDSAGLRVATQVDGVWTFFIFDIGGKKVAEYGGLQATDEGGVKYVLSDWQGSSRAILSNSGYVNARMDYTAFGEEIQSNIGQRTAQGYAASDTLNQKYALTERDKATGLDHTWFRKLENQAGRWTSPDPYNGSMNLASPQSFNRYSYVENQPTNFVDPSGLMLIVCRTYDRSTVDLGTQIVTIREETVCEIYFSGGGGVGGFPIELPIEFPIEPPIGPIEPPTTPVEPPGSPPMSADEIEKIKKRLQCEEDFADEVFDIIVDNALMTLGIGLTAVTVAILTGGAAAVVALIVAAGAGAIVAARSIYKVYAADRDRKKCLKRIG